MSARQGSRIAGGQGRGANQRPANFAHDTREQVVYARATRCLTVFPGSLRVMNAKAAFT